MKTSQFLVAGNVFTRAQLKEAFKITDASINNGIFRPKEHDSIWLFVTKDKSSDRRQYDDSFDGSILKMDSQPQGRPDEMLIHHVDLGLEVLMFYRSALRSHDAAGFRFEGSVEYRSHIGDRPKSFVFEVLR